MKFKIIIFLIAIPFSILAFEKIPSLKALATTSLTQKYSKESTNNNDLFNKINSTKIPQELKDLLGLEVISYRMITKTAQEKVEFIHLLFKDEQFKSTYNKLLDSLVIFRAHEFLRSPIQLALLDPYCICADHYKNKELRNLLFEKYPFNQWCLLRHLILNWSDIKTIVDFIKEYSVNINENKYSPYKQTALHWACLAGRIDCLPTLLRLDARNDVRDENGNRPSNLAREEKFIRIADYIENYKPNSSANFT